MRYNFPILLLCYFFALVLNAQKPLDLMRVNADFKVSEFYKDRLKKTEEAIKTDPKTLNKEKAWALLSQPFFAKDTLSFFNNEMNRFPGKTYIAENTDWMSRKLKPVKTFGYSYKTLVWNDERDRVAKLNNTFFARVNMVESLAGYWVLIDASTVANNKTYEDLLKYLTTKFGDPKTMAPYSSRDEMVEWRKNMFIYRLTKTTPIAQDQTKEVSKFDVKFQIFNTRIFPELKDVNNSFRGFKLNPEN